MTGPRLADVPATYSQEFDCDRRCRVDVELEGRHIRFTLGQMIETADRAHRDAHKAPPVRTVSYGAGIQVHAAVPAVIA